MKIQPVESGQVAELANLLERLARKTITFEFSSEAQDHFLEENNAAAIERFVLAGFRYWVATIDKKIVGFIGIRDASHIYHLFVAEEAQRKGVATRLWKVAKLACLKEGNQKLFTVNSSNNAIPFYESFGFERSAPMKESNGVLYNPMVLNE